MNKKVSSVIAVYGIVFVLYNVIFWCVPFERVASNMIAYAFSLVAIILGLVITGYAFKNEGIKSKVYGFPIFKIGAAYTIVQIAFGLVMNILTLFGEIPSWIVVVASVLILGLSLIGVIATDNTRDVVEEMDQVIEDKTKEIKRFRMDVAGFVDGCKDSLAKKKMERLADAFKYSDPVSNDGLAEIEEQIRNEVDVLKNLVLGDDVNALISKIDEVHILLADRNRRCKEEK